MVFFASLKVSGQSNFKLLKFIVLVFILVLMISGKAYGNKSRGRVSVDNYFSSDSNSIYKRHFITTRLRYDAVKFNKTKTLSYHIDTRIKKVVEGKNYHQDINMLLF